MRIVNSCKVNRYYPPHDDFAIHGGQSMSGIPATFIGNKCIAFMQARALPITNVWQIKLLNITTFLKKFQDLKPVGTK